MRRKKEVIPNSEKEERSEKNKQREKETK